MTDDNVARNNKILIDAVMAKMKPIMDKKVAAFRKEILQSRRKGFARTGVGTDNYSQPRYRRDKKSSFQNGFNLAVIPKKYPPEKKCSNNQEKSLQANGNIGSREELTLITTNTSTYRETKVSDQMTQAIGYTSHDMITHLSCPKEAEKCIGEVEERSAIHHSFVCPDKDVEPSVPDPRVPADPTLKDILITTAESPPHLLLEKETGSEGAPSFLMIKEKPPDWQSLQSVLKDLKQGATMQTRLSCGCTRSNAELIQIQERALTYFVQLKENPPDICRNQDQKNEAMEQLPLLKTSLEAMCFLPLVQSDLVLNTLTPLEPEQPSGIVSLSGKTQRSLPVEFEREQLFNLEPEHVFMPFPRDYPRKHCKKIDLAKTSPNLFVIVSAQDEKRFGLENVKEFRVSHFVFDKLIPSFEVLTPEKFSKHMGFLIDEFLEFSSSLRVSLCSNMFDLFGTKTECTLFKTWPELNYLLKSVLCESNMLSELCKLNLIDNVLEVDKTHSKMRLAALSMCDRFKRFFIYSYRTFDVVSLVFVKATKRQVKDSMAKTTQILSNQVDYGPRQRLSYHSGYWNWKYLRKTTPNRLGDLALSQLKTTNQNPGKRPRRIQKWKEDHRFKPPNLDQNKRHNFGFYILIKEEPPDVTYKPKPRLLRVGGNLLNLHDSMSTNLLYVHADNSDLRTNPFQLGGDDMNLDSPKIMELVAKDELAAEVALIAPEGIYGSISRPDVQPSQWRSA